MGIMEMYLEAVKKPEFYKLIVIMMFILVLLQIYGMVVSSYTLLMMSEITDGTIEPYTSMQIVDIVRSATTVLACIVVNKL